MQIAHIEFTQSLDWSQKCNIMRWRFLLFFIYSEQIVDTKSNWVHLHACPLARVIDNWADYKQGKTIYEKTSVIRPRKHYMYHWNERIWSCIFRSSFKQMYKPTHVSPSGEELHWQHFVLPVGGRHHAQKCCIITSVNKPVSSALKPLTQKPQYRGWQSRGLPLLDLSSISQPNIWWRF